MNIKPITSKTVPITTTKNLTIFAVSAYQEPLKTLILSKLSSNALASKQLAQLIWKHSVLSHIPFDYLVPIPLHWKRYAHRGFNQADILAYELSKLSSKPIHKLLMREKKTLFQSQLSMPDKIMNLKGAFTLLGDQNNRAQYQGKHIILVDDLMTSGATLQEAARKLLVLKPAKISAIVACRMA